MDKIVIGRKRKKSEVTKNADCRHVTCVNGADAVFVVGAVAVCTMLALPMMYTPTHGEESVAVMSKAVQTENTEREELVAPSNAESEEWNFYDYIGELFAGLLSGKG